jgi:hypothetical protein
MLPEKERLLSDVRCMSVPAVIVFVTGCIICPVYAVTADGTDRRCALLLSVKKDLMPHRIQRLKSRADTRHRRVSDVLFAAVRVSSCIQRDTVPAKPPRSGVENVDKGKTLCTTLIKA